MRRYTERAVQFKVCGLDAKYIHSVHAFSAFLRHFRFLMGIIKVPRWFRHKILFLKHPFKSKTRPLEQIFWLKSLLDIFWMHPAIELLESPIPTTPATPATTTASQKASSGDISGTKRRIIDPLVSKRPEKF